MPRSRCYAVGNHLKPHPPSEQCRKVTAKVPGPRYAHHPGYRASKFFPLAGFARRRRPGSPLPFMALRRVHETRPG